MSKIRLSDAIPAFADSLRAHGKKPNTVKNNLQPLNRALELWGNIYLDSIQPRHIDTLFAAQDWAPATHNLYLANLKANFFPWARRHKYIPKDYDPCEGWRSRRVPKTEKLWIPVERFSELLDRAPNARDRALISLGLFTFARGAEICSLQWRDIDFDEERIHIYRRKSEAEDRMPMPIDLRNEMLTWMRAYEQANGSIDGDWYVIPWIDANKRDRAEAGYMLPITDIRGLLPTKQITRPYYRIKPILVEMGYDDFRGGTHTMRRSGARAYFQRLRGEGFDSALMETQEMLGHATPAQTMKYIGVTLERERRNERLAGKVMFPDMYKNDADVLKIAR